MPRCFWGASVFGVHPPVYNIYVSHCMIPIIWKIMVLNLVIYPLNLHVELINIGRMKELQ